MDGRRHVSGYEVYSSPEFRALCDRFGIAFDLRTVDITLKLTEDHFTVTQTYRASKAMGDAIDTTNLHNKEFRTKEPRPVYDLTSIPLPILHSELSFPNPREVKAAHRIANSGEYRTFPFGLIEMTEFNHGEFRVAEVITRSESPSHFKLIWALVPFIQTKIDGRPNPCVHCDFQSDFTREEDNEAAKADARRQVRQRFEDYHGITAKIMAERIAPQAEFDPDVPQIKVDRNE